jgi:acyl carrier protein
MTTTATDIETWIVGRIVAYGKLDAAGFTAQTPLNELGLDSVYALTLCGDIEDEYGIDVDPSSLADYKTISELAEGLRARLAPA